MRGPDVARERAPRLRSSLGHKLLWTLAIAMATVTSLLVMVMWLGSGAPPRREPAPARPTASSFEVQLAEDIARFMRLQPGADPREYAAFITYGYTLECMGRDDAKLAPLHRIAVDIGRNRIRTERTICPGLLAFLNARLRSNAR